MSQKTRWIQSIHVCLPVGNVGEHWICSKHVHHGLYFHLFSDLSAAANTLTNFLGSTFFLTVLGGFISDTYLNWLHTGLIFGFLEITGLLMMTIQAHSWKSQSVPCNKSICIEGSDATMFYASLCILALGCGGVKGSVAALGADQFDLDDMGGVASYFNYYQFSTTVGSLIGVTAVVWIALNEAWHWDFFTGLMTAFVGFVVLGSAADILSNPRIPHGTSPGHTEYSHPFNSGDSFTFHGYSPSSLSRLPERSRAIPTE